MLKILTYVMVLQFFTPSTKNNELSVDRIILKHVSLINSLTFSLCIESISMPRSPLKSLSVREDADSKRSLHVKTGENSHKSISNFYFSIVGHVEFEQELHHLNGYLLEVVRTDGEIM